MRTRVLLSSVDKRLDGDERTLWAAYMWTRHRWMVPFAGLTFVALVILAIAVGFETWPSRIGIGLAGAAVAGTAATDYRILAKTDRRLILLESSRIRQYATELVEVLPPSTRLERLGGTMLTAEWSVAGTTYTVAKSSEQAMSIMADSEL